MANLADKHAPVNLQGYAMGLYTLGHAHEFYNSYTVSHFNCDYGRNYDRNFNRNYDRNFDRNYVRNFDRNYVRNFGCN